MTQLRKTLALSLSLATFSFMTSPAFAQNAETVQDKAVDMATDKAKKMAKDKVSDTVKNDMAADIMVDEGEKMVKEKMGKEKMMTDKKMTDKTVKETGDVMKAPAVMESPVAAPVQAIPADTTVETVQVNCPPGTTAQADGTCMITGDYEAE